MRLNIGDLCCGQTGGVRSRDYQADFLYSYGPMGLRTPAREARAGSSAIIPTMPRAPSISALRRYLPFLGKRTDKANSYLSTPGVPKSGDVSKSSRCKNAFYDNLRILSENPPKAVRIFPTSLRRTISAILKFCVHVLLPLSQ